MFVVTFSCFIVITENTLLINNKSKPIFEKMAASCNRGCKTPNYYFNKGIFRNNVIFTQHQFGVHVGDNNNIRCCCQEVQHNELGYSDDAIVKHSDFMYEYN